MKEFQIWLHEGSGCKHGGKSSSWTNKTWYLGDILYIESEEKFVEGRNAGFVGLPEIKDAPVKEGNITSQIESDVVSSPAGDDTSSKTENNRRPGMSVSSKVSSDNNESKTETEDNNVSQTPDSENDSQDPEDQQGGEQNGEENDENQQGGEIEYEYYIPTYVWYIVAAAAAVALVGAGVLLLVLKKKKKSLEATEDSE